MFLCIDTITADSGVALVNKDKCFGFKTLPTDHASERLISTIDELLDCHSCPPCHSCAGKNLLKNLKAVFVIKGPGSFTGLRVGISVANQFAHQLKIPIIGLKTNEWARHRTAEKAVYLQTMNRDELYCHSSPPCHSCDMVRLRHRTGRNLSSPSIIPIASLTEPVTWFGHLSADHITRLPKGSRQITRLKTPKQTWLKVTQAYAAKLISPRLYELVEPFYGKEPTITKSKRDIASGK
jgi:tRNA threonylcarbamoyl adenosine modification protein YeaZ